MLPAVSPTPSDNRSPPGFNPQVLALVAGGAFLGSCSLVALGQWLFSSDRNLGPAMLMVTDTIAGAIAAAMSLGFATLAWGKGTLGQRLVRSWLKWTVILPTPFFGVAAMISLFRLQARSSEDPSLWMFLASTFNDTQFYLWFGMLPYAFLRAVLGWRLVPVAEIPGASSRQRVSLYDLLVIITGTAVSLSILTWFLPAERHANSLLPLFVFVLSWLAMTVPFVAFNAWLLLRRPRTRWHLIVVLVVAAVAMGLLGRLSSTWIQAVSTVTGFFATVIVVLFKMSSRVRLARI